MSEHETAVKQNFVMVIQRKEAVITRRLNLLIYSDKRKR